MLQPTTFKVIGKLLLYMKRQGFALRRHHFPELGIVLLNDLV
jgi:hypothetical protein